MSAKNYLFFLILAMGALSACEKDNTKHSEDNISFHEFSPNLEITDVDSFAYTFPAPNCSPGIPFISVPSNTYELDINSDSHPDFNIIVGHKSSGQYSTLYPCENFIYYMDIKSIYANAEISRFYELNEAIDGNSIWSDRLALESSYGYGFSGVGYLGLRIKNGEESNYAWIKLMRGTGEHEHKLIVMSHAFNETPDNSISAGQEQ